MRTEDSQLSYTAMQEELREARRLASKYEADLERAKSENKMSPHDRKDILITLVCSTLAALVVIVLIVGLVHGNETGHQKAMKEYIACAGHADPTRIFDQCGSRP